MAFLSAHTKCPQTEVKHLAETNMCSWGGALWTMWRDWHWLQLADWQVPLHSPPRQPPSRFHPQHQPFPFPLLSWCPGVIYISHLALHSCTAWRIRIFPSA